MYDVIELFRDVATGTPNDAEAAEAWYYKDSKGNPVKSNSSPQPGNDIKALGDRDGQYFRFTFHQLFLHKPVS